MRPNPNSAYNNLPELPPRNFQEDSEIYKLLIRAHKALSELKGYSELLPNKNIILSAISLKEAKDSSEIENIITTHDELYKSLISNKISSPEAKEVINYKQALFKGLELIKEKGFLSINIIKKIQAEIEQNNAGIRKLPGTKLINPQTNEIFYTPPDDPEKLKFLLSNLENFINREDEKFDHLTKLAIIHYQFEAIHPFYDANGRTGRIVNVLYLVLKGLINEPYIYISGYLIKHKPLYYKLLREVTFKEAWKNWILFFLEAIEQTALHTLKLAKAIINQLNETTDILRTKLPKIYTRELVELLFTNVYVKIINLETSGIASRNTAANYLNKLVDIGILDFEKVGREKIFINKTLLKLLKNFDFR